MSPGSVFTALDPPRMASLSIVEPPQERSTPAFRSYLENNIRNYETREKNEISVAETNCHRRRNTTMLHADEFASAIGLIPK